MKTGFNCSLNGNLANISGRMSYESLSNVQDADLVNTIKGFLNNGSKGGVFLASRCTNTPDSTKYYKIRFTKLDGSVWIMLEAWNTSDTSLYYISEMNPSTSAIASWKQYALKSDIVDMQTLNQDTYNTAARVYKVGRLAFITCVAGSYYCDAGGAIKDSASGTGWTIASGFRPVNQVEIKEALNNKRITIMIDGQVTCNEALNGTNLRFSGCYIIA